MEGFLGAWKKRNKSDETSFMSILAVQQPFNIFDNIDGRMDF